MFWGRVLLGVTLGVAMMGWPYANECGWGLLQYGGAVGTVLITAAWIAFESWKRRSGPAHVIALILFYWGLVLGAEALLPRIGYASDGASWSCPASLLGSR